MGNEELAGICCQVPKKLKKRLLQATIDEEKSQVSIIIEALEQRLSVAC